MYKKRSTLIRCAQVQQLQLTHRARCILMRATPTRWITKQFNCRLAEQATNDNNYKVINTQINNSISNMIETGTAPTHTQTHTQRQRVRWNLWKVFKVLRVRGNCSTCRRRDVNFHWAQQLQTEWNIELKIGKQQNEQWLIETTADCPLSAVRVVRIACVQLELKKWRGRRH